MKMNPVTIVIPLHHGGGKFRNDTELRFALRSIEKHFTDPYEIVIVSRKLPAWLGGVKHIYGKGLKSSLVAAAEAFPDGFFWYYDDCVLIRDTTAEEMKVTPACKGWQKPRTGWARKLDSIRARLVAQGLRPWDYSRPHGPYWFDKSMVDEGFADWPGMEAKFPWESWILSKRDWPRVHGAVKQYYGSFKGAPASGQRYVNYSDAGNTPELRAMLENFFPEPSRHETGERMQSIVHQKGAAVEVHTIRFGEAWWVKFCAPTLDRWCRESGYHLRVWDKDDIPAEYPTAKFCQIDMLREFLSGDSEWLLYVDADVYVHPDAGGFPVGDGVGGFMIRPDRPSKFSRAWPRWCNSRFGRRPPRGAIYRNAGVWACDRQAAEQMLAVISPPYHEAVQEQHHWNWWIACAAESGMRVSDLPQGWNNWPSEDTPGSFYHLCGRKKYAKVCSLRDRGLIPRDGVGQWEFDQVFDFAPYRFAHCGTLGPMDEYHIQLLYAACTLGGRDKVAVEIGSYRGASTAAMVEAVNQGWIRHLHVVEVKPTDSLKKVIGMCRFPDRVTLHTRPSWELKIERPDLVFIDGDHKWPAVGDTLRALTWGSPIICMHDSQTYPTISGTWGAKLAAGLLAEMVDRDTFEDAETRDGMLTYRGFFVSCVKSVDMAPLRAVRCYRVDAPGMEDDVGFDDGDDDGEISDFPESSMVDAIVMVHAGAADLVGAISPMWVGNHRRVSVVANSDCSFDLDWADDVVRWDGDPGRFGVEHCRRMVEAVRMASLADVPVAILEHDSAVCGPLDVLPGVLYCSQTFVATRENSPISDMTAKTPCFAPWVATPDTWCRILSVLSRWMDRSWVPDSGYADRVMAAAAEIAGVEISPVGFNRWPNLLDSDLPDLRRGISSGTVKMVHGVKDPRHAKWLFAASM